MTVIGQPSLKEIHGRADDIEGIDFIHAEVKFVQKLNIENAMEQAVRDNLASKRKAFPTVFHKKNRQELLVTMRFDDWLQMYNEYYSSMKLAEREKDEERKITEARKNS